MFNKNELRAAWLDCHEHAAAEAMELDEASVVEAVKAALGRDVSLRAKVLEAPEVADLVNEWAKDDLEQVVIENLREVIEKGELL